MEVEVKERKPQETYGNAELLCLGFTVGVIITFVLGTLILVILIRLRVSKEGPKYFTEQLAKSLKESPTV